jgi:hypothetical protein
MFGREKKPGEPLPWSRTRGYSARLVAALVIGLTPSVAHAEIPLRVYRELTSKQVEWLKSYIVGVGRGVFWTQSVLKAKGKEAFFCMPAKLKLDEGIILSLLDQEIRQPSNGKPYTDDVPVEFIMIIAFTNRFPC